MLRRHHRKPLLWQSLHSWVLNRHVEHAGNVLLEHQAVGSYDEHLYKARHLIENFFARLKQYCAIATRYDKTARNFLVAIHLAASVIWLN